MLDKTPPALRRGRRLGIIHNRLRDWDGSGNHPGYALGCWLRDYKEQVFLFTRDFAVDWTNNVSERGAKAVKRHQAVSGYWHCLATLSRWCRIRSYLDSAANHGLTALDAISTALAGEPWLPADSGRSLILVARWCGMGESLRPAAGAAAAQRQRCLPAGQQPRRKRPAAAPG